MSGFSDFTADFRSEKKVQEEIFEFFKDGGG